MVYFLARKRRGGETFPEMYILDYDGGVFWTVGPSPGKDSLGRYVEGFLGRPPVDLDRFVGGLSLAFAADVVYSRKLTGAWKCVKNRMTSCVAAPLPPFTSIEEAAVVSAANGWPDPVRLLV